MGDKGTGKEAKEKEEMPVFLQLTASVCFDPIPDVALKILVAAGETRVHQRRNARPAVLLGLFL